MFYANTDGIGLRVLAKLHLRRGKKFRYSEHLSGVSLIWAMITFAREGMKTLLIIFNMMKMNFKFIKGEMI